jgi:hypothetical protein
MKIGQQPNERDQQSPNKRSQKETRSQIPNKNQNVTTQRAIESIFNEVTQKDT